jgi:pimeloyl-ACP methyl ester carboxylesterase
MADELTFEGTSTYLNTDKGRIHYHEAGEGPPLILLHGSGPGVSGWANFRGNFQSFVDGGFRTLIVDLPGFGRSDPTGGNASQDAPEGVLRFMDGMGIESAGILGNSMGGGVGARVASSNPERVNRLVTIGGVGLNIFTAFPAEGIKLLVDFIEDPTRERLVTWMESMVYDKSIVTEELVETRFKQASDPGVLFEARKFYSKAALENIKKVMAGPESGANLAFLSRIQCPTLITWGRDDRVSPADMFLVPMRLIPKCEVHVFYNCGHWAMIERKEEFESVVIPFFQRG